MKKLKNWRSKKYTEFINEISSNLLKRASKIAYSHGQENLSKKFSEYRSPVEMKNDFKVKIKNPNLEKKILNSYVYDIYVDTYNLDGDDENLYKVVKTKIIEYDQWDDNHFVFFYHLVHSGFYFVEFHFYSSFLVSLTGLFFVHRLFFVRLMT